MSTDNEVKAAPKRGFAAFGAEELSRVSSRGGMTAQARGSAHRFTAEQARAAARVRWEKVRAAKSDE